MALKLNPGEVQVLGGPGLTVTTERVKARSKTFDLSDVSNPSLDLKPQTIRMPHPFAFGIGCMGLIVCWVLDSLLGVGIFATVTIASFFYQRQEIFSFVSADISGERTTLYRAAREKDGELAYLAITEALRLKNAKPDINAPASGKPKQDQL